MTLRSRSALVAGATVAVLASLLPAIAGAEPGFSPASPIPSLVAATSEAPGVYSSVWCVTATSCTAVGPSLFGDQPATIKATVVTDRSGTWTRKALPVATGSKKVVVNGVVCSTASVCTAVGGDETGSTTHALVETDTSGTWSESYVSTPKSSESLLNGLWCASQGNCVAVGLDSSTGKLATMVATESSGVWSPAANLPAPPAGVLEAIPYSIACHAVGDCSAIAFGLSTSGFSTIAWTETSSTWGAAVVLPPAADGLDFAGRSIQCPTATTCLAVGSLEDASGSIVRPASDTELSGTWSAPAAVPLPKLSPVMTSGSFTSLSCTATICEAVGLLQQTVNPNAETVAGAATWSGGTWSSIGLETGVQIPEGRGPPAAGGGAGPAFDAVSCATDTSCVGVGTYKTGDFSATVATQRSVTLPGAPEIAGGAPGVRSAMLFWTPPVNDGGSAVTSFTATVQPGDEHCTTGAYHCTVTGLTDGHAYDVSVVASNTDGAGPQANGDFIAGGAPSTPRAFHVVAWSKGIVTLSWHPSVPPPGMHVTSYDVEVFAGKKLLRSLFTHATTLRLGGLVAHHRYLLTLSASDLSAGSANVPLHVVAP
jgi:Fibronectin type III domain